MLFLHFIDVALSSPHHILFMNRAVEYVCPLKVSLEPSTRSFVLVGLNLAKESCCC